MDRAEQLAVLSGVAADQWGLVTTAQAKNLGLGGVQLKRLVEAGLLENVGRGVYALSAAGMPRHLEIKVAWLRLQAGIPAWERRPGDRDSGVVSHASACQLHGLGDIPAPDVEISVPRRRTTTDPFVRLRTARLDATDITVVDGLPVTTVLRTIVDLLRVKADGGHVGGVIADAERRDLVDVGALADAVQPHARKYGLSPAATGQQLLDHLVGQAGRTLHSQEVARAGAEGVAAGKELAALESSAALARLFDAGTLGVVLTQYADALQPLRDAMRGEAYASVLQEIAAQQVGIRTALTSTMAHLVPVLQAVPKVTPPPTAGRFDASGLRDALQQALAHDGVAPAWKAASLAPRPQRMLWKATVPGVMTNHSADAPGPTRRRSPDHVTAADEDSMDTGKRSTGADEDPPSG
ncbi:type IV toxin-antitoxin system AbiEi family antitoxin domain-containing protein [Streptomyces sp. SID4956]|uniref:type IV toxin-antitoxin system AbiEi family antitoxin domain-containing protein n=1 Tax=Streptomyces sp. SID4956 TaxID=2690290 RepID=UPI00136F3963|nr:transcriptional regulator [Streptomyces sp. SID4956]